MSRRSPVLRLPVRRRPGLCGLFVGHRAGVRCLGSSAVKPRHHGAAGLSRLAASWRGGGKTVARWGFVVLMAAGGRHTLLGGLPGQPCRRGDLRLVLRLVHLLGRRGPLPRQAAALPHAGRCCGITLPRDLRDVFVFLITPILVVMPLSFNAENFFTFTPEMLRSIRGLFSLKHYRDFFTSRLAAGVVELGDRSRRWPPCCRSVSAPWPRSG